MLQTEKAFCMLLHSLLVHMSFGHAASEGLVFLVSSFSSGSYTLCASSSVGLSEFGRERFDEDIPFGSVCFKVSHSLLNV